MGGSSARKRKEAESVKQDRRALLLYEPNLYKAFLTLALPVFGANFMKAFNELVDTFFIGQTANSVAAQAGVSISWPLINIFAAFQVGFGVAGVAVVSQLLGAGRREEARENAGVLLAVAVLFGVVLNALLYLVAPWVMAFTGATGDVFTCSVSYLRVRSFELIFTFIFAAFQAVRQAQGDTVTPVVLSVSAVLLNIVLTGAFVQGLGMGVFGAGLATVLGNVAVAPVCLFLLFSKRQALHLEWGRITLSWPILFRLTRIAAPAAFSQALSSLGFLVLQTVILSYGEAVTAAFSIGNKISNILLMPVLASNWKYNYSRDTNSGNELGFSKFDIPHRVMAQVAYTTPKYWNNWMSTSISVIYNGFSGNRYSLTMNESADFNGDGFSGNSLLYIPTDEELNKMEFVDATNKQGEVTMTAEESRQAFKQWIEDDAYAKNHRGQYAERNSNLTKWEHEINLHLAQTIYNPKGLGKLEFTFDIINFANMLNKKWGATYGSLYNLSPISVTKLTTVNGQTTPNYIYNKSEITKSDVSSRWHAQVGVRLTF